MKKLKLITCLVICQSLIFGFQQSASGQNWQWAKQGKGIGTKYGWSISNDSTGNLYITGSFSNTAIFDTDTLTSTGSPDVFIVKYDNLGNVLWSSQAGGTDTIVGYGIISDNSGNSYITGYFKGTVYFDDDTLISTGGRDVFVTKYDLSGNVLWAVRAGSTTNDEGFGIKIDGIGNIYVTGYFTGTSSFGTNTLNSAGIQDMFLAKYNTAGNVVWAKRAGNIGWDEGDALSVDALGNIYVTGTFEWNVIFGTDNLFSSGYSDVFIARYDSAGNAIWGAGGGGAGWYDSGLGIAVDESGNSYITGYYYGPATFGAYTLTLIGSYDMFLVKYDASGNELWAKKGGGTGVNGDWGTGIGIDMFDNCYVTGRMEATSTFGSVVLNSTGAEDVFVVKYDPAGNAVWGKKAGGSGFDAGNAIVLDNSGNCYVTGIFQGNAYFNNDTLNSLSGVNVFVAKLGIVSKNDVSCNGVCDGQATVDYTAGVPPYTYLWNTMDTTQTIDSLCAGTYSVDVVDANSDTVSGSAIIIEPPALIYNVASITDATCYGFFDGNVTGSVSGGSGGYTYLWNDSLGQTTATVDSLCAGTYSVTVTDADGCMVIDSITVNEPAILAFTTDSINVSCTGGNDGSATVTTSGGISPYTYLWDDPDSQTDSTAAGLTAGTYNVIVTDNNGCIDTVIITITQPASALSASITDSTDILCYGNSTGSATVTPSGGTPSYTYLWNPQAGGQTNSAATGLTAGTYHVNVYDANGCADSASVTITQPTDLSLAITDVNDANCGLSDGSATVTPSGGIAPYTYLWNDSLLQTDSIADSLYAASYTVIVIDANGCSDSISVNINNIGGVTVSITGITHVSCNGDSSGSIVVTPAGGTPPYTYLWDSPVGGQTDSTATGLPAGIYTAAVTDSNGCVALATDTITQPASLALSITGIVMVACNGDSTGSATVTPSGGASPYNYLWSDTGMQTDSAATGLPAGTFTVVVTDNNGCVDSTTAIISEPGVLNINITDVIDVFCNGDSTGSATGSATGGTTPYTYLWDDPQSQTDSTATGLSTGTYCVTVTDANGCQDSACVNIDEPTILSLTIDSLNVTCNGACDGVATITPSGGTPPYTYLWNDSLAQTDSIATGLCPGTYCVIVTDASGCQDSACVNVDEPAILSLATDSMDVTCNGVCSGVAIITPSGGTPPYTYLWSDTLNQTDSIATGLCTGTYCVTVTDANGCQDSACVNIDEPVILSIVTDSMDITCYGACDGVAIATPSGGTPPYTYLWDLQAGGQTDSLAYGLCVGTYCVTVTDANGCQDSACVNIDEPLAHSVASSSTDALCSGNCDGTATVIPSGFTPPYIYLWDDSLIQTTSTATGLCAGTYTILVTDANGCTGFDIITINEPSELTDSTTVTDETLGNCDGEATVIVSGGTQPYSYQWDNGDTTATADSLCVGVYYINITDANGCMMTDSAIVDIIDRLKDFSFADQINIYPNPNSGEFVIEINIDKPQNMLVKLFDLKGQLMLEEDINKISGIYRKTINLKGYSKGVYHLQILVDGVVVNRNIVVQ
ncbi:MAG: T9SS type A sorting domain-containing protein [Bacteroidota bacterium]